MMKKIIPLIGLIFACALILYPFAAQAQPYNYNGYGYGMGPGVMGGYGPGGGYGGHGWGMGPGMMGGWVNIPPKLPEPKNAEWVQKLRDILVTEKESLAQYESDQEKFNAYMPYMMVIPQEQNHIYWIDQLFAAYGLPAGNKSFQVVPTKSLTQAYEIAVKLEAELLPRYEWLVKNAEDRDSAASLNTILLQSRWHLVMFEHALRIGPGPGYGPGYGPGRGGYGGGMGPGMMWGYRGGYGPQYPPQYRSGGKPIDIKEAKSMMKDYLKSSRNPNLKLGKIRDIGNAFEAEILTKKNSLVDKIIIDKQTGWIRSAY
jgi:hypothetical protein